MVGTELFRILFLSTDDKDYTKNVRNIFNKLIKHTDKTFTILSRTWLVMIKDVIDCLLSQDSKIGHLEKFLHQINQLSELLIDVFFEMSRELSAEKAKIDISPQEQKDIVEIFRKYLESAETDKESSDELRIHTYYRSIPIELNADVKEIEAQSVTFKVHPYEAVALSSQGQALVKSAFHLKVFMACVDHVDIKERIVTCTHFIPWEHPLERRAHIRVEPKEITKITIYSNTQEETGRIYDFSEAAIAIYLKNTDMEQYETGSSIQISTKLLSIYEKEDITINTSGTITKIYHNVKGDNDAHRIIIHWNPDSPLKSKLSQYISQRQVEVMKELKELSEI